VWLCRIGFMYDGAPTTFSSCNWGIIEQHAPGMVDRMRKTNNMTCSFPWFKSLRFLCVWHLKCTVMQQKPVTSMTCNSEYRMDVRGFVRHLESSSKSRSHFSGMQHPSFRFKVDTVRTFSLICRP
jgi:hypothetical protein